MKLALNKWATPLLMLGIGALAFSLWHRWLDHDEAMLGEHSYWFLKLGYYRSVLHEQLPNNWAVIQYSTHKFFVVLGSLSVAIFGWSIEALRIIPFIFSVNLLLILYKYSKKYATIDVSLMSRWVLIVMIFQAMFFAAFIRYRPETMLMTLGLLNFILLERYLTAGKIKFLIGAGVLGGLALFTHLNASAYVGATGLILLAQRKVIPAAIYGVVAALFGALYLHNMIAPDEFQAFLIQYRANPNLSDADWHWYSPIVKMLSEHLRFFHSPREIATSLLAIISLIGSWQWIKKEMKLLLSYLLLTILILGALSRQTPIYYLIYLPYLAVIIAAHLSRFERLTKFWKYLTVTCVVAFVIAESVYNVQLIQRRSNTAARTQEMADQIPPGSKVLAPLGFLFNALDQGYEIRSFKAFKFHIRNYDQYEDSYEGMVSFLNDSNNDFIILDHIRGNQDAFRDYRDPSLLEKGDRVGQYSVTKVFDDWTLLARVH